MGVDRGSFTLLQALTFMKISGVQKEDQGNPEQESHRVRAGGGLAALSKHYPHPFPLPLGKEQCFNLQWEKKQKSLSRALGKHVATREGNRKEKKIILEAESAKSTRPTLKLDGR